MFLNKTVFKKMIKSAFNGGGLTVGLVYDGLVLSNGYWVTYTEIGSVPNWVKAAVMEYAGELPKAGTIFRAAKNEPIQYEIAENQYYNLPERFAEARYPFADTKITVTTNTNEFRLLQKQMDSSIICLQESLANVIDLRELGNENAPMGPSSVTPRGDILIWKNEASAYAACKTNAGTSRILDILGALQSVDFSKEDR